MTRLKDDYFEEVTAFGDQFKTYVPIVKNLSNKTIMEELAEEIISVQPMDVPFSEDFLALQAQLEHEIRMTFGYDEHALGQVEEEFFTEEEFNL
jgi:hypothetical protein